MATLKQLGWMLDTMDVLLLTNGVALGAILSCRFPETKGTEL